MVGATLQPDERSYDHLRAERAHTIPPLQDPEKLAALLYTSGTSGRPRAAMLTHRALLANIDQVAAVEPPMIHGDDVVLAVLPMFHVYGLNAVLGVALHHRAKVVLAARFDPQGTLDLIEDEACSVIPVAPPVFAYWRGIEQLRERLGPGAADALRVGAAVPGADRGVHRADRHPDPPGLRAHRGLARGHQHPGQRARSRTAPSGRPCPASRSGWSTSSASAPEGEDPGQISIRGANLFSGYWPDGADGPDLDGWWSTGDVGFLDPSGDLFLVDRLKELVIVSGFNVYPVEVEEVIREVDGVTEAAVIGVDDEHQGEAVVAYVVAPGRDAAAVESAVREHCETRLARFKRPSRVEVVGELPVGVTGKVQKGRLRGMERRRALGLLE